MHSQITRKEIQDFDAKTYDYIQHATWHCVQLGRRSSINKWAKHLRLLNWDLSRIVNNCRHECNKTITVLLPQHSHVWQTHPWQLYVPLKIKYHQNIQERTSWTQKASSKCPTSKINRIIIILTLNSRLNLDYYHTKLVLHRSLLV